MKHRTLTALTALLLLTGTTAAQTKTTQTKTTSSGASTGIEALLVNTDPIPLQAGESGDINLKLRNTGDTEAENVEVHLADSFPFKVQPDRQRNYSLGDMTPGQEYQISTDVLVAEDAPDGTSNFKLKISYGDFSFTEKVPVEVQSQDIELNLANIQTQPSTLMPDTEDNQLTVETVNNGDKTAENVVLKLEFPEYFEKTSSFSTREALGNLKPGQVKKAEFKFDINRTAPEGMADIPATLTYTEDDSTAEIKKQENFNIHLNGKPQYKVTNIESDLVTGQKGTLRVTVKNTGEQKSTSTRIRVLDSSDLPFSYDSSSQFIGTLKPGQSGQAVFQITTEQDAAVKDYLLDFEIRGVKDTEVFTDDKTLKLNVKASQQQESGTPTLPIAALIIIAAITIYYFRKSKNTEQEG